MTGIKQSNFTQVTSVDENDNIPLFTRSENKRITYENMRDQLADEIAVRFIYPTTAQLQQSNLEADEDEPNYVRCEETEYRLYKITALSAGVDDIALDNGMTATYQEEYSKSGFVLGAASSTNNALALFDGATGTQLKTGAVLSTIGGNLASATSIAQVSYPRVDAANAVTMATPTTLKTDLNLPSNTSASISNIESDISTIENDISTIESDIVTIQGDIVDINADLADKVKTVETFSDLATAANSGGVVYVIGEDESYNPISGSVTTIDGIQSNSATGGLYYKTNKDLYSYAITDFSGLIQTHGKKVVITGDSLSYNNYGFGFPYAATAQEANAGLRSWGFLLRDAIHMSDPCFVYGDNIPWHINNASYAAVAINNTGAYILPFNNRSLRVVVSNASAELTITINSFNIANKQIILHLAHAPSESGAFDIYYNDNTGGADVFVSNVVVGDGVDHQGYEPFTVTIPVNTIDTAARIILKNFSDADASPLSTPMAFYVLAAGSKLTNVYTTGAGGQTAEYFVTNYASKIGTYAPDLLILCIGANDRLYYSLQRHLDALETIFNNALVSNPYCKIILITTPPALASGGNIGYYPDTATNTADSPAIPMRDWIAAVERCCKKNNVAFFNQYRMLYDLDGGYLFVDGIHLTRNAGRDVFKALIDNYFPKAIAPVDQLHGYSTYSVQGTGDLMGRQIGAIEKTKATPDFSGQFKLTYVHATQEWTISEHCQRGTNRPYALKSVTVPSSAHTTLLDFYGPVVYASYNEAPAPINAAAYFVGGTSTLITSTTVSTLGNNTLKLSIRDSSGALIDPATINGAQILVKYWQY